MQPSIPNIITYAYISEYLALSDLDNSKLFNKGKLDETLPIKINIERKSLEWAYAQNVVEKAAKATFTVNYDSSINEGDTITISVKDPNSGEIVIGEYEIQNEDTNGTILAENIAASINQFGYSAISYDNVVIVTAPLGLGNKINGILLNIEYEPLVEDYFLINDTDALLINDFDKLLI